MSAHRHGKILLGNEQSEMNGCHNWKKSYTNRQQQNYKSL